MDGVDEDGSPERTKSQALQRPWQGRQTLKIVAWRSALDALHTFTFLEDDPMTAEPHKVAFYADLFYRSEHSPAYWIPPGELDVEALLLGGDIHYLPDQLGTMLEEIRETQRDTTQIIVVPGNGEYIDRELDESRAQYRAAVESVHNAVFLDDEVIILSSGIRVIGSTLWSLVAEGDIDAYTEMLAGYGLAGVDNIRLGEPVPHSAGYKRDAPSGAIVHRRRASGPVAGCPRPDDRLYPVSGRRYGHGRAPPAPSRGSGPR